jgi:hypothetical protein
MTIAMLAICCLLIPGLASAAAPNITYTATGTFAAPPTSGDDTLKLAGEPFEVTITVSAAAVPYKTGPNWAAYNKLHLTGTVHSGLLGPTPVAIASGEASLQQALDPGQYDQFEMQAPIKVVGIALTIKAIVEMPWGTISSPLLHPFSPVTLAVGNTSFTYSDGTSTTVLGIQSGTLTATIPTGGTAARRIATASNFSVRDAVAIASRRFNFVG